MMVTVLLPVYNSEKFIDAAIKSILLQTFTNFEILIVDDGSYDNTEIIVNSFNDNRIRYLKKTHTGLANTLNVGLENSKYDWVARMDADDIAHPMRLEKQVNLIDNNTNKIIFSKAAFFTNNKLLFSYDNNIADKGVQDSLILHSPIPHSSVLYNRNFIIKNNGYDESLKLAEDYELWLRIRNKVEFKIVDETLMFLRYSPLSMSNLYENENYSTIYKIQNKYYSDLNVSFNVLNFNIQNIYNGWREFFFGDQKLARKYWLTDIHNLFNYKILLALFISFLPKKLISAFKRANFRPRLEFILHTLMGENKHLKQSFEEILKSIYLFEK